MRKSLGFGLTAAAVIATAITPAAGWAAVTSTALPTSTLSSAPAAGDPDTTITFTVTIGALSMTAPGAVALNATAPGAAPGTTVSGALGPVVVTDDRALLAASWAVTASSTAFTTGGATGAEVIPATDATYTPGTIFTTGTITTTGTTVTLANAAVAPVVDPTVVAGTAGVGNNTATWDPTIAVAIPDAAVGGTYTGTLTQSVA